MEKKYIIGMAKSTLKLKSGQSRNLELDVLRLIHFMNMFENKEIEVYGFMLVHNDTIKNLIIKNWLPKYNFNNPNFEVLTFENENEFIDNKLKILIDKSNNSNFSNSNAKFSEEIIENVLANKIEFKFGIGNLYDFHQSEINGIKWDFQKVLIV